MEKSKYTISINLPLKKQPSKTYRKQKFYLKNSVCLPWNIPHFCSEIFTSLCSSVSPRMSEAFWSRLPFLITEILVAVLHPLTFLQLSEMVTNWHLQFRKHFTLILVRPLSGPGKHPPSRAGNSVGKCMGFSRLSPRSVPLLVRAIVNRPRSEGLPPFPLGAAFSWDFSAVPARATPQLCSSYVCVQSPTSVSLTRTHWFGFLARPQTSLTAAELLGGHCTVSDPDQSLDHCLSSDLKSLLCILPPCWLGHCSCILYDQAWLLTLLPLWSSWPLLLPENCWVLKAV